MCQYNCLSDRRTGEKLRGLKQMSASREKQLRQELEASGVTDPKTELEAQQAKKEKRSNALYAVIGVVFVLALVVSIIWRSNIIPKNATALTIDGEKYTAAEVNFYYWNSYNSFLNNYSYLVSYMGLDTTASPDSQVMDETAAGMLGAEEGTTWGDYFMDQTQQQMAAIQNVLKMAEAEGYVYTDSVQTQYDGTLESLETTAAANGTSLATYLQNAYGSLMTEKVFTEQLMRVSQYSDYITSYYNGLDFTEAEITAAYEADPDSYDRISYQTVSVKGAASSTTDADGNTVEPTEEESAAALAAAKAAAEQLLADYKAGGDLEALAESVENATYASNDEATYFTSDLGLWLFDQARKPGDTTIIESGTTYYVAVFGERFLREDKTMDVRHILFMTETGELTSEDEGYEAEQAELKAAAKAKADAMLEEWKAGEATEESFAALATANTEDTGSMYTGGLYENVYVGQMVEEFENWCFDAARKPGDTGVVETTYGAHVMYYVGENLPYWQYEVKSNLMGTAYNEWLSTLPGESVITPSDFGMGFVG